ncbi:MAG TPA: DUF4236 domain-containing protein [Rhizomicrobium sp.]|nr:DUF4236 domain-containing protein [Rhizomicrobium sp.]
MAFRFQKRISILPGVRVNLSKSGVSTSLGPRGADVTIGKDGATANAGIPGTGLSYRQKLGGKIKGVLLGVLAVVGGLGFWAFQHQDKIEKATAPAPSPAAIAHPEPASLPESPTTASQASAVRFVHREGSILRDEPKASGKTLKKESKGVQVMLLSESDGWAMVTDGNITGYMRSSILGATPPQ